MKGYVYTFTGSADDLARFAREHLGDQVWHWVADPAHLDVQAGYPQDWKDQGAVFNAQGELRWRRENGTYQALFLTETPVTGLTAIEGTWEVEEQRLFLQDLSAAKVHPPFNTYPTGKPTGSIAVHVFKRDGMAVFVSLRAFEEEQP